MLLSVLALAGCAWKGSAAGQAPERPADLWLPEPASMRIYPSSRFVFADDGAILEARIELLDAMGDSVKGAGQFHFELASADRGGDPAVGGRLYAWDVELRTLEHQEEHYDAITRTYLFRLRLDDLGTARRATVLAAVFFTHDQRRLEAQAALGD